MLLYTLAVGLGVILLNRFLISFELLLLVTAPTIMILFLTNSGRYMKSRNQRDLVLIFTWLWLGGVIGLYYLTLSSGLSDVLWSRGIWFSENDVLHLGLITWMLYIAVVVARTIKDAPAGAISTVPSSV
jgi:hypothetical protein